MFPFPFSFLGTSLSAAFNYSASEYCENAATDPTPTITGTSGGTFSAALKVVPFQMQFEVASGVSKTITIPATVGSSYTVDWGDGATTTETSGSISHTYNNGSNTDVTNPIVSIGATGDSGAFTSFAFVGGGSASDLLDVPQWGNIVWSSMINMFRVCNNSSFTTISATDIPDLSSVTNLAAMFRSCTNLASINNINNWDVSNVKYIDGMFQECTSFNQDLSNWDVSSVINMSQMFNGATSFNGDISSWNVSSVTNMSYLFRDASSFNQSLNSWNTGSVINMFVMFLGATSFNGNISSWNTSSVRNMAGMFQQASSFNQSLNSWNTGSVTNMANMFQQASSFNGDVSNWNTSSVTSFSALFYLASNFNKDVSSWDVSSCTSFFYMFSAASSFNQNLSDWYVNGFSSSLSTMATMFNQTTMTSAQFTDTIVGWAVAVRRDSAPYNVNAATLSPNTFDGTRTQDTDNSGNSVDYSTKYGSDWDSNWNNAGDARQFLLDNGWSVS